MARYTCFFTVALPVEDLHYVLSEVLGSCNCDVIYQTGDYIMARENPGQVPFSKLVTVEILIDKSTATDDEIRMNLVMKNEELPLQVANHCNIVFHELIQAISENRHWQLIEQVAS